MKEQIRAWIYCRIDAPEDVHDSLKNQKKELYDYAEQMGFIVVGSSADMGSSLGRNHSGLLEIERAAQEEKMDVLLVKKLDRLGRDAIKVSELISILHKQGIAIYSSLEGEITLDLSQNSLHYFMKM